MPSQIPGNKDADPGALRVLRRRKKQEPENRSDVYVNEAVNPPPVMFGGSDAEDEPRIASQPFRRWRSRQRIGGSLGTDLRDGYCGFPPNTWTRSHRLHKL